MKDIETHSDGGRQLCLGLLHLRARFIGQVHASFKSLAPIGNDMLQVGPLFNHLTPALAAAIGTALARQPSPADRLDSHQDGLAMKENFV